MENKERINHDGQYMKIIINLLFITYRKNVLAFYVCKFYFRYNIFNIHPITLKI